MHWLAAAALAASSFVPSGEIVVSDGDLVWGGSVSFDAAYSASRKADVYVTVVCVQGDKVVYQWSADPSFTFPLVQQDGLAALGLLIDPAQPGDCSASLLHRTESGKRVEILTLDRVAFTVQGG